MTQEAQTCKKHEFGIKFYCKGYCTCVENNDVGSIYRIVYFAYLALVMLVDHDE